MPERVLIASEDAVGVGVARAALEAAGHFVRVATDVEHALAVTRSFVPRVVLIDVRLLALPGPGLVPRFRAASLEPVAVVALGQTRGAGDAGVDGFVAPSSDPATLLATIAAAIAEARPAPALPGKAAGILVVDESKASRAHIRGVLEARGYRVRGVGSVAEAGLAVHEERPDLILKDILLPDTTGVDLSGLVRRMPGGESLPIIGISARFPSDQDRVRSSVAFDAFLAKPVDTERLIEIVERLLPAASPLPRSREEPHLLVVDDDPVQLRLAKVYLENAGFRVTASADAAAALELALVDLPRLIVSDVLMPGMDGFDLTVAVRENAVLRDIPVILISAYFQDPGDLELTRRVGADALVPRTRDFAEVIEAVRANLGARASRSPVASRLSRKEREKQLIERLERQITLNAGLAQRCASQGAQLSILGGVADALAANLDVRVILHDVLARCLDTSRLSRGALFRVGPGAKLVLDDSVGFPPIERHELEAAFGHTELLEGAMRQECALVLTPASSEGGDSLLARARAASGIVVPLVGAGHRLGALLLLSNTADVSRKDLLDFGKAIGAHLGQAMALGAAFSRLSEAERKSELLTVLAHELRGPLAPILASVAVLSRKPDDPEAITRASSTIERQARHLARMVDDLLDTSRLAHGKVKLIRERLDLVEIVREVAADYQPVLDAAGLSLSIVLPADDLHVDGDRTRLAQVFTNLLANAVKFTPRGGRVHLTASARGQHDVAVSVRDTGVGIQPDMIARVFEPFAQADRTLERSAGGLGLGLTVVKGLVELHGGRVAVTSGGANLGSDFTVVLPCEAPVEHEDPALADVSEPTAPSRAPCRILVIDDNRDTAQALAEFLDVMGYTTEVAHTGSDGVEKARRFGPEIVLCDIGLPGMDGYAVAAELRARPGTPAAKLVALTGYGGDSDVERALQAGFDRHITKPVTADTLLQILTELGAPPVVPTALADFSG